MKDNSLRAIPGVGEKREAQLQKLGLRQLSDFLTYYPRDYEDRTRIVPIAQLQDGDTVCVSAVAASAPVVAAIRRGMTLTKLRVFDSTGQLSITWFNNPYVKQRLQQGMEYIFYGKVQVRGGLRSMAAPTFERADDPKLSGRILPIYPAGAGISQKLLRQGATLALTRALAEGVAETLPAALVERYKLCSPDFALRNLHFPEDRDSLRQARRRLTFEELFLFACASKSLGSRARSVCDRPLGRHDPEDFYAALPFAPTGAQRRAVEEIFADLCSGRRMNRLLQGDVGSGKTLVAAAAAWLAAQNGRQTALMAPTELLARQHAASLTELLSPLGLRCGLLVSSMPAKDKRAVKAQAAAGEIDLLIGTHALLQEDVTFADAALFVVDEQHRFGVEQRAELQRKAQQGHMLVMSATPIPRTMTLILYGDLDLSVLDELPPGRQPVLTYAVGEDMRQRMTAFIEKQVKEGGRTYVVCPRIEESEEEGITPRRSAAAVAADLQRRLPHLQVGLMHSRLKAADKEAVMAAFAAGEVQVLVSTTVVEVGVNVPEATLMVVENADLFGLSQLHQLRGRVGRSHRQSYCILMDGGSGGDSRQRLQVLTQSNDGFFIAEEDLRIRGPGDFLGQRQHGLPAFRLADLSLDARVMDAAAKEADAVVAQGLQHYPALQQRVEALLQRTQDGALN